MTWVLIALLLLAAIGPVFWVLPSRTERRQMRLRNRAMAAGLQVRLRTFPNPDAPATERVTAGAELRNPTRQVMTYRKPLSLSPRVRQLAPTWRWLRSVGGSGDGVAPVGWVAGETSTAADPAYWRHMAELVAAVPASVVAVEVSGSDVALGWLERGEEAQADVIVATLEQLASAHENWITSQLRRDRDQQD